MQRSRLQGAVWGLFAAQAVWAAAWLLAIVLHWLRPSGSDPLHDLLDLAATCCVIFAAPINVGGWIFIWGDNGPPYPWIEHRAFPVVFGLAFYGMIGAMIGYVARFAPRFSTRTMFIAFTMAALLFGIAAWANK